jgi:DNA-binding XRE family transcriptional regulator
VVQYVAMKPREPAPDFVFDQHTFQAAFTSDLNNACAFIFVESAYLTTRGAKRFSYAFAQAISRGVRVCSFVQKPEYWERRFDPLLDPALTADLATFEAAVNYLRTLGVHVNLRGWTHLKLAVIDYSRTWGGTLNSLSYTFKMDDEVYHWRDKNWAEDTVRRRRLDECEECKSTARSDPLSDLTGETIGLQIQTLRKAAGLTQQELADLVGVNRETIGNAEKGKSFPRIDTVCDIFSVLQAPLISVPNRTKSIVHKLIQMERDR